MKAWARRARWRLCVEIPRALLSQLPEARRAAAWGAGLGLAAPLAAWLLAFCWELYPVATVLLSALACFCAAVRRGASNLTRRDECLEEISEAVAAIAEDVCGRRPGEDEEESSEGEDGDEEGDAKEEPPPQAPPPAAEQ